MADLFGHDDLKLVRDKARGDKVRAFLEDPDIAAVIKKLEQGYMQQLLATNAEETTLREHLYRMLNCLGDVVDDLKKVAGAGKFNAKSIDFLERRAQLMRRG